MNVGGVVGGTVAAIAARERRKIIDSLRRTAAISAGTARPREELGRVDPSMFRALVRQGVVVDAGEGRFYLDEEAEAEDLGSAGEQWRLARANDALRPHGGLPGALVDEQIQ